MKTTINTNVLILFCFFFSRLAGAQNLRFHSDGTFKIVQFTDTHFGANKKQSAETITTMNSVLDKENPDFVIFTGDNVTETPVSKGLEILVEPVASRHIPYLMVLGNHDSESRMGISRKALGELIRKQKGYYNIPTAKNISGENNYVVEIQGNKSNKIEALLYGLDSQDYDTIGGKKGYGFFRPDQIDWYIKTCKKYKQYNPDISLPALAFFHIPLVEYMAANDSSYHHIGLFKERPCPGMVNSGMFAALIKGGDVMGCFVGHDHDNDFIFNYMGMVLGYGHFTGNKNTYTHVENGARVFLLLQGKREFTTWVRLASGSVTDKINFPTDLPAQFPKDL